MSKRPKYGVKQIRYLRKKRLRVEDPEPSELDPPPRESSESDSDSEFEEDVTSQSSSIPDDDVFEDSGSQVSEALPYYPEEPQEQRNLGDETYPSYPSTSVEGGSRPLYSREMKPGPDRPDVVESIPAGPQPSTSQSFLVKETEETYPQPSTSQSFFVEETEETYKAVITQTGTLLGPTPTKRRGLEETKVYKISRSFPDAISLNEYNFHHLNLTDSEQIVIGVPRGIAFQYYNCKEFFLSISQIDVYIIEKKGLDREEIRNLLHSHVHLPGEVYMCKQTDKEEQFSRSDLTPQVNPNISHVHIKSIDDVMAGFHPSYSRSPEYLFVKSPPFAKIESDFVAQPSDLLYPLDFFEMLISAYENITPEPGQTFSYFRMIPGNFDVLLGIPKNSLNEEYDCYPKITVHSGVDMYIVGKERGDPNSEKVFRIKSDVHTHIQFPYGIRACMFKNTPTKYLQNSPCPHDAEARSFVHIPTSAVPASKTSIQTASLVPAVPRSLSEEELALRFGSESESSSSSLSIKKPNFYLVLKSLREGSVFLELPKGASCYYNPETNELEGLAGVNVRFIKDSTHEVCPKALPTASPHHVHLDFNTDEYLCRFEGNTTAHNTIEICTQLSVPPTTITAPSLNVLPIASLESEILKTSIFAIERKPQSSRPTLVPITCDVTSNLFRGIRTFGSFIPPKVTLRNEPILEPESVETATPSPPKKPLLQQMASMIYSVMTYLRPENPVDVAVRRHLESLSQLLPQSSVSPAIFEIPSETSYEMQVCPEITEIQPDVSVLQPTLDPRQMQASPDIYRMESSPDEMQVEPIPESDQMEFYDEPMDSTNEIQVSMDQFEIHTDTDPRIDLPEVESMEVDSPPFQHSSSSSDI